MSGALNAAWDMLATALDDAGLNVTQDPRNVTPPCVLLDAPSFTVPNSKTVAVTIPCMVLAPPPGNYEAVKVMLDDCDIIAALPGVLSASGSPMVYEYGDAQIPAYRLSVELTVIR